MHYSFAELERYDNVDDEKYYHYNEVNPVDILQTSYEQVVKDSTLKVFIHLFCLFYEQYINRLAYIYY